MVVDFFYKFFSVFEIEIKIIVDEFELLFPGFVSVFVKVVLENLQIFGVTELQDEFLNTYEFHSNKVFALRYKGVDLLVPDVSNNFVLILGHFVSDYQALKVLDDLSD